MYLKVPKMKKKKVNGTLINNLRYADDTVIIADSPDGLQRLLNHTSTKGDLVGLKINTAKRKILVENRVPNQPVYIDLYGIQLTKVSKFKYLGNPRRSE